MTKRLKTLPNGFAEPGQNCPQCGDDLEEFGQWHTAGDEILCYVCGRRADGLPAEDIDLDTYITDYCKWDEPGYEEKVDEWVKALLAVGVAYNPKPDKPGYSVSEDEVEWRISLRQAFELKLNYGWFDDFYCRDNGYPNLWRRFAEMIDDYNDTGEVCEEDYGRAAKLIKSLWKEWANANKADYAI